MNSNLTALEVEAYFTIGSVEMPVSRVSFKHTIDQLPYALVTVQMDNQSSVDLNNKKFGSVAINLEKFNTLLKLTQEKILNDFRVTPDTRLTLVDGEGSRIVLNGFLGRPEFNIQEGEISLNFSIVHAKSVLQAFNARIYNSRDLYSFHDAETFFTANGAGNVLRGQSIAERVKVIIETLLKHAVFQPDLTDYENYDAWPLHLLNMQVIKQVYDLLEKSQNTTKIPGIEVHNTNDNLIRTLLHIVTGAPNFLQSIYALNSEFMFQMNANYEGDVWLEWSQLNAKVEDNVIEAPLQNIRFSMANIFQLPILQVVVTGEGSDLWAMHGYNGVRIVEPGTRPTRTKGEASEEIGNVVIDQGDTSVQLKSLAKHPQVIERNAVGTIYHLPAPYWVHADKLGYNVYAGMSGSSGNGRISGLREKLKTLDTKLSGEEKARVTMLRYMAKQYFKSLYLGDTNAFVTIPFNCRVHPGYTYLVRSSTGEELFTGYLVSVDHTMELESAGAAALTSLSFSHVVANKAVLNGLEDAPKFPAAVVKIPKPNAVESASKAAASKDDKPVVPVELPKKPVIPKFSPTLPPLPPSVPKTSGSVVLG